jgi:hypothetical protein
LAASIGNEFFGQEIELWEMNITWIICFGFVGILNRLDKKKP